MAPLRNYQHEWAAEALEARTAAVQEVHVQMAEIRKRGLDQLTTEAEVRSAALPPLPEKHAVNFKSSSSSSGRYQMNGHGKGETTTATTSSSGGSSSGDGGREGIEWEKWKPWFKPECSLCRKEVQELVQQQQQQQRRREKGPSSGSEAAAAAAAAAGPAYHPWDAPRSKQQQQDPGQASTSYHASTTAGAGAAAAGGGGGGNGNSPPLHGSCYGAWPVPWDCPFKFRRLMWRLMGRVKPTALRFWAERVGMCAHATDEAAWYHVVSGRGGGGAGDFIYLFYFSLFFIYLFFTFYFYFYYFSPWPGLLGDIKYHSSD